MFLINPHSLSLLKSEKGQGRKLLMKYDGPFKIIKKISAVSYRGHSVQISDTNVDNMMTLCRLRCPSGRPPDYI
jgi:hypothetical protein